MNLRSMFWSIFGKQDYAPDLESTSFRLLNTYDDYFCPFDGEAYDDPTVRACIDVIAKNLAKLKPQHIRRVDGKVFKADTNLDTMLSTRPNEFMNAYDFLYKIASQLYSYNNAFVYVKTDPTGRIVGLYPLSYSDMELRQVGNDMYCRFNFLQGGRITVPYTDLIHLRRHFNRGDIFGESNERPFRYLIKMLTICKQALENAIKNCMKLRGYLKFNSVMRPEDQQKELQKFTDAFTNVFKGTGIGAVDSKSDYQQLTSDIQTADHQQMNYFRDDVYLYFGINENIVKGNYNEEQWVAFFQNVIEPIAIQMSQEFTDKVFTEREKGFGNEVVFQVNRLEYASLKNKTAMAQVLQQTGILTVNEFREIFGFAAVEDGDKRFVSLNYVNSQQQDKYQVGGTGSPPDNGSDGNNSDTSGTGGDGDGEGNE